MLYRRRPAKIFYFGKPVDFRKQTMGLAAIVDAELPGEMQHGHWFVFVSSDKKKAKILYWRGTGVALWQLRLDRDLFKVGQPRVAATRTLTWREVGRFLDGFNIFEGDPHEVKTPKRFA